MAFLTGKPSLFTQQWHHMRCCHIRRVEGTTTQWGGGQDKPSAVGRTPCARYSMPAGLPSLRALLGFCRQVFCVGRGSRRERRAQERGLDTVAGRPSGSPGTGTEGGRRGPKGLRGWGRGGRGGDGGSHGEMEGDRNV